MDLAGPTDYSLTHSGYEICFIEQFNDKPGGGGDRAAQHSALKMPLHRYHLVKLLGSFLPRISNTVIFRLVVKLAEGFIYLERGIPNAIDC